MMVFVVVLMGCGENQGKTGECVVDEHRFSAIEDGPWQVYAGPSDGELSYAGRVWAFDDDSPDDYTWEERFEGIESSELLDSTHAWYVTVSNAPNKPPECTSGTKCGRLKVASEKRVVDTHAPERSDDPCYSSGGANNKCAPLGYYHATGWYTVSVLGYSPVPTEFAQHLFKMSESGGVRTETFYTKLVDGNPSVLVFPRRGKIGASPPEKVDWLIKPMAEPSASDLALWGVADTVTTTLN